MRRALLIVGSVACFMLLSAAAALAADSEGDSRPLNGYVRSSQAYTEPGDTWKVIVSQASCKYSTFLLVDEPWNVLHDWAVENLLGPDGEFDPDDFSEDLSSWGDWGNCLQLVWRPISVLGPCDTSGQQSFWADPLLLDARSGGLIWFVVDPLPVLECFVVDPPGGNPAFAVVDNHPVTAPAVDVNPYIRGAVGLDTWGWYDTPAPEFSYRSAYFDEFAVDIPTYIDAIPITGDLWLQAIRWDFDGDGVWDREAVCSFAGAEAPPADYTDCAGTELHPAVVDYIFEERGLHNITVELQWTGFYDDPHGIRHYFYDTTPLVASTTRTFDVIEIRSELLTAL